MIFLMNRERKMGERKIDVTVALRHAPSTSAEFVVIDFGLIQTTFIPANLTQPYLVYSLVYLTYYLIDIR